MKTPRSSFKAAILLLSALTDALAKRRPSLGPFPPGVRARRPRSPPRLASPILFLSLSPWRVSRDEFRLSPGLPEAPQPSFRWSMEAPSEACVPPWPNQAPGRHGRVRRSRERRPLHRSPPASTPPRRLARRAEQLFHGGKLAEGRHGTAYGPAPFGPKASPPPTRNPPGDVPVPFDQSPAGTGHRGTLQAGWGQAQGIKLQDAGRNRNNIIVVKRPDRQDRRGRRAPRQGPRGRGHHR